MPDIELLTADQVNSDQLSTFLQRQYPGLKSDFLIQNGLWWHHSNQNRLVIRVENQIGGYCAVIPTRIWTAGQEQPALWWVDLVIDPEFRGRGLQTLFDRQVRQMADLLLGFPNKLAAKIHRKHGWGVREDLEVVLLPLWPDNIKAVHSMRGWNGFLLRSAALTIGPLAAFWRKRLKQLRAHKAWSIEQPSATLLASVFQKHRPAYMNTTIRDAAYFEWRYFASPKTQEYSYYCTGDHQSPDHYLIARHVQQDKLRFTRILDVFGDFNDQVGLYNLFLLAVQDALARHSGQVTIMVSIPELRTLLRRLGFWISATTRFCWQSASPNLMAVFSAQNYWGLADSDNDDPA